MTSQVQCSLPFAINSGFGVCFDTSKFIYDRISTTHTKCSFISLSPVAAQSCAELTHSQRKCYAKVCNGNYIEI